jgi:8-oxo-dGTP pyrophosphatase MutT (NUDIX family)
VPPESDVPPTIPAATVVIAREAGGLEVLLLKRSEVGPFPGMWVFPGGRVDDTDDGHDELARARTAAAREAAEEVAIRVDADALVTFSHWTPPVEAPKRFATWFFVAPWSGDEPVIDDHEIVEHRWVAPGAALEASMPVAPPTFVTLLQLAEFGSLTALLEHVPTRTIERFLTRTIRSESGNVLLWHGDRGYEEGRLDGDGPVHRLYMTRPRWRYERTAS